MKGPYIFIALVAVYFVAAYFFLCHNGCQP